MSKIKKTAGKCSKIIICFGVICIIISFFMGMAKGPILKQTLNSQNTTFGPIIISSDNTPYRVDIHQDIQKTFDWSYVSIEVLDEKKEYLYSFGNELWREEGYDEGHWVEEKNSFSNKLLFSKKGTYYLQASSENKGAKSAIHIEGKAIYGSALPFVVAGIFSILLGFFINEIFNKTVINAMSESS